MSTIRGVWGKLQLILFAPDIVNPFFIGAGSLFATYTEHILVFQMIVAFPALKHPLNIYHSKHSIK